jgi:hypothetical protein
MTKPGPAREMLHCKMCGHNWKPLMASRVPKCCSYCGSPHWREGKVVLLEARRAGIGGVPQAPVETLPSEPPAPDPHQPLRDLAREEFHAYLNRRALRDEWARQEHKERRGHRRYEPDEVESAAVRPPLLQTGVPFTLAKMTLTRRSRRKK